MDVTAVPGANHFEKLSAANQAAFMSALFRSFDYEY